MELEHRFEVPVGIDKAWMHLLDMKLVAACFPGATLSSADGSEYTGTVKVKLGPIQLTYAGSARIVSADEATHTATIEASGNAARSGSTASMTVVAAAESVASDRTAVTMKTDLTITGRPAQFGRGVMVEVGDKILGRFADCLASTLAASEAPGEVATAEAAVSETAGAAAGSTEYDASRAANAAEGTAPEEAAVGAVPEGAATGAKSAAAGAAEGVARAAAGAHAAGGGPATGGGAGPASTYTRAPGTAPAAEPIDLLASARGSIIKRVVPLVVAVVAVLILRRCLRHRRARRAED
ncbi:MAG: hypothetical protein BGO26_04390 [Actinobacteria bacterium 69-20]|nr:SRPBCC family protein [Actinomycetota bacterium]OJV26943.1 MAG: hypothetical protein BGO26_04390 [Actinobacteria bacterium 69-20]